MTNKKDRNLIQLEVSKEVKEEFKRLTDAKGVSMAKWLKVKINEFIEDNK